MAEHGPRQLVTFTRADGKSVGKAYLDECEPWVQTKLSGSSLGQDIWNLYQSNPKAWEGEPPPPPTLTDPIDTFSFHKGNIEPTLYRSPQGEWFRRLWWHEYAGGGLGPIKRCYTGLTEEQAHEWLRFNGYDVPIPVQNGAASEFYDEDADILPTKGESMTVAEFERLLFDVDQLHERAGFKGREWGGEYPPGIRRAIHRREALMRQAPGFADLKAYLNIELGQWVTKKAVEDFVKCLARKLRKPFDEVGRLSLEDALASLNQPDDTSALAPRSASAEPIETGAATKKVGKEPEEPTREMFRVYHAIGLGIKQKSIADELGISQASVSRYNQVVRQWIQKGGKLPGLDEVASNKRRPITFSVDPRKMERYTDSDTR